MKIHRLAIVLIVLLTTNGVAAAPAAGLAVNETSEASAQSTVTLTVTVTDNLNNAIDDVKLTATWDDGSSTAETASNGMAFLDVKEGARVEIETTHSAYTRNNPFVVEEAKEDEIDIVVSQKADATVTVVDEGSSVSEASVTMYRSNQDRKAAQGQTDGNGVFESGTIEQGTYRIIAEKEGYLVNETTVRVTGSTETNVAIEEEIVNVEFSVTDDNFEEPKAVKDATVEIQGATSATLSSSGTGTTSIGLPVNAEYTITVQKDGYVSAKRTIQVDETSRDVPVTLNREPSLTLEATNDQVVVGQEVQLTVTDEYGEQVEGATISVDGEDVGQTNADGVYRASIDSAGEHAITAAADDVDSEEITVEGVSADKNDSTQETTDTNETDVQLPDFSQPNFAVKIGVAAVGVLFSFMIVRRLL